MWKQTVIFGHSGLKIKSGKVSSTQISGLFKNFRAGLDALSRESQTTCFSSWFRLQKRTPVHSRDTHINFQLRWTRFFSRLDGEEFSVIAEPGPLSLESSGVP